MVKITAIIIVLIGLVVGVNILAPINTAANTNNTVLTGTNITDLLGTVTESGVPLYPGLSVLDVTGAGTFTTHLADGTTGIATGDGVGGNCTLIGSPVTLADALVLDTGVTVGDLDITLNLSGAKGAAVTLTNLLPLLFVVMVMVFGIKGIEAQ